MKIIKIDELITKVVPRDTKVPWLDEDTNKVQVHLDFSVELEYKNKRIVVTVPAGYYTDWSSIPKAMWWLYPPNFSEARRAAVLHDFVYSHLYWYFDKKFADLLLKEVMLLDGASKTTAYIFHKAVSMGGKGGWYYKKREDSDMHWKLVNVATPTIEDI
jgi:hypothetical protein